MCRKCKHSKDVSEFYWSKTSQEYFRYCKECKKESTRQYKIRNGKEVFMRWTKTKAGKQKLVEATKRARNKFPEKWTARRKLRYEVKVGRIIKPLVCDTCKENKVLQGHHDDYSKPLMAMWLCTRCHADRHKYLKDNNIII